MIEARSYVVTSGKGGVGKTTCVVNIGAALSMAGFSVVLVDADIGLRNLDVLMGLETRVVYDLVDVIERRCDLEQALVKHAALENLFLLPAAQARDKSAVTPAQMAELIASLKQEFAYVLVDSPAGIEQGFRNAVSGADRMIIVTSPELTAVRDADRVIGLTKTHYEIRPLLVINRLRHRLVARGEMMGPTSITDILAAELLGVVPEDENVIVAANRGIPVVLGQNSPAMQAFKNIAARIRGQSVPWMEPEKTPGFFERLCKAFANR